MPTKVITAGNRYMSPPPTRDINGITADEFAAEMFEFQNCEECAKDAYAHVFVIGPTGGWFAYCDAILEEK